MVAAAEEIALSKGLSHVTTRAIARKAGCSEAALYVHFPGREELLLAVLEESLPHMLGPLAELDQQVGHATPARNLAKALTAIFGFQQRIVPLMASLFSEPELLANYREKMMATRKGPRGGVERLERYLRAEVAEGRVDRAVDCSMAAKALMAGCFFHAFTTLFFGSDEPFRPFANRLIASELRVSRAR